MSNMYNNLVKENEFLKGRRKNLLGLAFRDF